MLPAAADPWSDDIEGSGLNFTISPRAGEPRDVAAAAAAALEAEIQPTHLGGETGSLALNGGSSVISSVAVGDGDNHCLNRRQPQWESPGVML